MRQPGIYNLISTLFARSMQGIQEKGRQNKPYSLTEEDREFLAEVINHCDELKPLIFDGMTSMANFTAQYSAPEHNKEATQILWLLGHISELQSIMDFMEAEARWFQDNERPSPMYEVQTGTG